VRLEGRGGFAGESRETPASAAGGPEKQAWDSRWWRTEVRNLAQRCAQAARDTAGLIEESIETSRDGNVRLDQMAGAVRGMTECSGRVKSLVDEVNLKEQNRGMDQIAKAVLQMQHVTQKNAAAAEQSASAGAELNSPADALRTLVLEMREMAGAG
jgi:methyl-accepting chemotaxis protein